MAVTDLNEQADVDAEFDAHVAAVCPPWFRLPEAARGDLHRLWQANDEMARLARVLAGVLEQVASAHTAVLDGMEAVRDQLVGVPEDVVRAIVGYDGEDVAALADLLWDARVYPRR